MRRSRLVIALAALCLIGVGAAGGAVVTREYTMKRGDYATWPEVNAYCGQPAHPTWGDYSQVVCIGQDITTGVIFTFTDLYVVKPTGRGWKVIYRTKRCC